MEPRIPMVKTKYLITIAIVILVFSFFGIIIGNIMPRIGPGISINALAAMLFLIVETPARLGILTGFSLALLATKFKLIYTEHRRKLLTLTLILMGVAWALVLYIANLPLPTLLIDALKPDAFQMLLFHFNYTHLGSTLTFVTLFAISAILTKKPILAVVITLGCIGVTEFICIPIHYIFLNGAFMGIAWYLPFAIAFYPFLISIPNFRLAHKKLFWILLFAGFVLTVLATFNAAVGWDVLYWDGRQFASRPLDQLVGGIGLTLHHFVCRGSKLLIAVPFTFIRLKEPKGVIENVGDADKPVH